MIAAVIPTRFYPPEFWRLRAVLEADGVTTVIVPDGVHDPSWSLYHLWSLGVQDAIEVGAEYIAVLNDDITILPGTLEWMANRLQYSPSTGVVYPNHSRRTSEGLGSQHCTPTASTWGAGGMTGFCFMFRANLGIPFDESYHLWYGDDAFEEAVRAKGLLVARIDGLPIDHTPNGSTSRLPEAAELIARDRLRWDTRQRNTVQPLATVTA